MVLERGVIRSATFPKHDRIRLILGRQNVRNWSPQQGRGNVFHRLVGGGFVGIRQGMPVFDLN